MNEIKEKYQRAEIDVVEFSDENIILTSGNNHENELPEITA